MLFLFAALLFQFTIYNRTVASEDKVAPAGGRIAAGVALCLWFGVGLAGRGIGFLGQSAAGCIMITAADWLQSELGDRARVSRRCRPMGTVKLPAFNVTQ